MDKEIRVKEYFITKSRAYFVLTIDIDVEYMKGDDENVVAIEKECALFLDRLKSDYSVKE